MIIIKLFSSLDLSRSPAAKPTSIAALKIAVFYSGEVIETSMASDVPNEQLFTEIYPGLRIVPGIKLTLETVSKDGDKPAEFIIWYRVSRT